MNMGHHDTESLKDALQVIDDWNVDSVALFGLDDTSVPPTQHHRKPCPKIERLALLHELEHLQAWLMQHAPGAMAIKHGECLWKPLAIRQRHQRNGAADENAKLRSLLKSQLQRARRAVKLAHKASLIHEALGWDLTPLLGAYDGPRMNISDQIQGLDGLALEAKKIFSWDQFIDDDCREMSFHTVNKAGLMVQMRMSWALPFDITSVVDALWYHTTCLPRTEQTKDIYKAEDTVISQFVSCNKNQPDQVVTGSTHGQIAMRFEPPTSDGTMLLVSTFEAHHFHDSKQTRSHIQGDGLVLVRPLHIHDKALCRVHWYRRIIGSPLDDTLDSVGEHTRWVNEFTRDTNQKKIWRNIDTVLQSIENMLLTPSATQEHASRRSNDGLVDFSGDGLRSIE